LISSGHRGPCRFSSGPVRQAPGAVWTIGARGGSARGCAEAISSAARVTGAAMGREAVIPLEGLIAVPEAVARRSRLPNRRPRSTERGYCYL
jgi:hypothetical protein